MPAVGAAVGFAQDPDADRLAIVDETGRYIGEELTLALAGLRRLEQAKGPVVLNLSTSRVTEDLARRWGCPVFRTPVGEINVVERMVAENAVLGGEGNGGVIDPRVGYRPRQLRGDGDGPRPAGRNRRAAVAPGRRLAAVCDGQGPVSARDATRPGSRRAVRRADCRALGPDRRGVPRGAAPIGATACGSTGTTAGCTSGPAIPSRSCG